MEKHEKLHIAETSHVDLRTFVEELDTRVQRVESEFNDRKGRIRVLEDWQTQLVGTKVNLFTIVGVILTAVTLVDVLMRWFVK